MQPQRYRKSQLISITITLVLALIITNTVVIHPANYGIIFQSSADDVKNKITTTKSTTTIITTTIITSNNNNDNYADSSNRKVTEESSTANANPSSFVVVQKRNIVRTLDNNSASSNTGSNDNLTKSTVVLNTNRTYYRYTNTKSKNQIANLENNINSDNNSNIGGILNKNINIALVAPTFTAVAYDDNSFYTFYKLYGNTSVGTNVTSNLSLLSRHITNHDILRASIVIIVMLKLVDNLKLINPNSHVTILTDADVDNGSLFNNNNNNNLTATIASYGLNYQKGKVVALGIFSDDVIDNATFNKFFDRLLTKYATNTGIYSHQIRENF